MKCNAPVSAAEAHKIPAGGRRITIPALSIRWGDKDIRDDWVGDYTFCCFQCLAEWATEKSEQHDDRTLVEGDSASQE